MPYHHFIWLLVVLTLSLLLVHLRHRRRVTAEIQAGLAVARDLLNSTTDGIIITNDSGIIKKFNQMAEHIFGYKADYIIGKNFLLLMPDELHPAHQHTMSGSIADAVSQDHEIVARRSDGTTFPLSLKVKPARQHGKLVFVGMVRDLSAIKLAEATSWKNQQLVEFLLKSSPIVFYSCNISKCHTFTYVSPNIEEIFGLKPETITAASSFWRQHVHPDDLDRLHSDDRFTHLNQGRVNLEYRLKLPDGSYRWIADSHTLVNDDSGKPNLMIGRWTDIHERKEAELELAARELRLNVRLKYTELSTWEWFTETGKMSWSDQISQKLGLDADKLEDFNNFIDILHPEDREPLLTEFRQCLVNGEPLNTEQRVQWPDKSVHWIHLMGELVHDETGNPVRMTGVIADITAQKKPRVVGSERRVSKRAS